MSEQSVTLVVDDPKYRWTVTVKNDAMLSLLNHQKIGSKAKELFVHDIQRDLYISLTSLLVCLLDSQLAAAWSAVRQEYLHKMEMLIKRMREDLP